MQRILLVLLLALSLFSSVSSYSYALDANESGKKKEAEIEKFKKDLNIEGRIKDDLFDRTDKYGLLSDLKQKCPKVDGAVVASYSEGWHWIIGNNTLQWGADIVFSVGKDNYIQCFCPKKKDGFVPDYKNGVETRWLKASNISVERQEKLKQKGWIYWANGADFGLSAEPYLALNTKFNCKDDNCIKRK